MISAQDWKATKSAKTNDTDQVRAIEALASLLEGSIPPASAAQSIAMAYTASLKATKGCSDRNLWCENKVSEFWSYYMSDAISCFGSTEEHARLTSLLFEISKLPDLKDDDGVVVKSRYDQIFWSDVPGWDPQFASTALCKLHHPNQQLLTKLLTVIQIFRVPQNTLQKRGRIILLGFRAWPMLQDLQPSCSKKAFSPLICLSKRHAASS